MGVGDGLLISPKNPPVGTRSGSGHTGGTSTTDGIY